MQEKHLYDYAVIRVLPRVEREDRPFLAGELDTFREVLCYVFPKPRGMLCEIFIQNFAASSGVARTISARFGRRESCV